jgi:(2Fe-2S) ferredoxin
VPATRYQILVCRGPTCGAKRNSRAVYEALGELVDAYALERRVELGWKTCFGRCTRGPNALVRERVPDSRAVGEPVFGLARASCGGASAFYTGLEPANARALIREHVLGGAIVARLLDRPAGRDEALMAAAGVDGRGRPGTEER